MCSCSAHSGQNHDSQADQDGFVFSDENNGLRLGVKTDQDTLYMKLENVSAEPLIVYSHVLSHETHYDWFGGQIYAKEADVDAMDKSYIQITFSDSRDKSAAVTDTLAPGEFIVHRLRFSQWLLREVNNMRFLNGKFQYVLTYENHPCEDCSDEYKKIWTGYLETPPVNIDLHLFEKFEMHVKILSVLPVGWGFKYIAEVVEERSGRTHPFGNEFVFAFLATGQIELPEEAEVVLFLKYTGEYMQDYLKPCNCGLAENSSLWEIEKMEVFIDETGE